MNLSKILYFLCLLVILVGCKKTEDHSDLNKIMSVKMIGVLKGYFENIYGPAKRIHDKNIFQYDINGCKINIEYDKQDSIHAIELANISEKCNFDASNIYLTGMANQLTFNDLILVSTSWNAKLSCCLDSCGNAADPFYGMMVETSHVSQFIQYDANVRYNDLVSFAGFSVKDHFANKYSDHPEIILEDIIGTSPSMMKEYNEVWAKNFANIKISSIKFGFKQGLYPYRIPWAPWEP
jgi:hypothetical protein